MIFMNQTALGPLHKELYLKLKKDIKGKSQIFDSNWLKQKQNRGQVTLDFNV